MSLHSPPHCRRHFWHERPQPERLETRNERASETRHVHTGNKALMAEKKR
jgi:hypothetical protein